MTGDTTSILNYVLFALCIFFLPFINLGLLRKFKATMQNRLGGRLLQPFFDFIKLLRKDQTISETTTWIFRLSAALNASTMLLIAVLVPWLSFKPTFPGDDLFLLLYLLAVLRFMIILSALDAGSSFGAFGASREAFLGMLVEPAMFISLCSVGLLAHSSSLSAIFDLTHPASLYDAPVWLAAAAGLYLSSIVDLSRMPIDDPNTHLELTMVHEAMILENSGKNMALVEFAHLLKMVVLYGLTTQCLMHAFSFVWQFTAMTATLCSIAGIVCISFLTALIESLTVKMQWTRTAEFVAYALTMSLFATGGALIGGYYAHHGL